MEIILTENEVNEFVELSRQSSELISSENSTYSLIYIHLNSLLHELVDNVKWANQSEAYQKKIDNGSESRIAILPESAFRELEKNVIELITKPIYKENEYFHLVINPLLDLLKVDLSKISKDNKISGLLEQLRIRQNEINKEVKNAISSMENQSHVNINHLEREAKRVTSDLLNNVKRHESETFIKLEQLSSDTQLKLEELVSTQRSELFKFITEHVNAPIDKKRKDTFEQLEKYSQTLLNEVKSEVEELSSNVEEEVKRFRSLHEQLSRTLSIVSSDVLADTTIKQAEKEKKNADWLRAFGLIWLGVCIYFYVNGVHFSELVDATGTPQYTLIILRSFLFIAASTPAFYLLRESARHRTDERRYRQKGIQLATIDGYLAEFEESDRNTVKKELTKHYFHGGDHFVDSSSVDNVQGTYEKILDRILASEKDRSKPEA